MTTPSVSGPSLAQRALYAVLLMVGFYVLAIGIAGTLLYLPYAEWHFLGRVEIRLLIFCVGAALAILAAVAPRIDRFVAPGPELAPGDHPRLFSLVDRIATATAQAPPRHVYLVPDLNAWVAERGGLMGFGSERVMGVGLPLLQALSVPEFSAVLAHEFGHFHGGDTRLGPWIHKTRSAIGRTLATFSQKDSWLGKPFEWYGNFFLRITHAVSRQQEYAADALAARVVGAAPLASGLKSIHACGPAFPSFWTSEVVPVLQAGLRPPIAEGFRRFLSAPTVAPAVSAELEQQLASCTSHPYDTHPPLSERLAALPPADAAVPAATPQLAISLLDKADTVEQELLRHFLPREVHEKLTPVNWDDLAHGDFGRQVWLPGWQQVLLESEDRLKGLRAEDLPALAASPGALAVRFQLASEPDDASARNIAESRILVGAAVAVALHRRGFSFTAPVGEPVVFTLGTTAFKPFQLIEDLGNGSLSPDAWAALSAEAGIAGRDLAELTAPTPS